MRCVAYFFGLPSPAASRHIARWFSSAMAAQRPAESSTGLPGPRAWDGVGSGGVLLSGMVICGVIVRSGRNSPGGATDSSFSADVKGRVWGLACTGADAAGLTTIGGTGTGAVATAGGGASLAPLTAGLAAADAGCELAVAGLAGLPAGWAQPQAAAPARHKAAIRELGCIVMQIILDRIEARRRWHLAAIDQRLITDNRA